MFDFLKNRNWPIALDLGSDSVKLLQLKRAGGATRVAACAKWRIPESVRGDAAQRRAACVLAVREILRKGNFHGRSVLSALSCADLNIKSIRLPSMSPPELAKAVQAEARERFGFEVAPDQLCYLHAGQVRQGVETREEVVMMAAPRAIIEDHINLLGEMGLRAQHIDAEPIALFRVFERYLRRRSDEQTVTVIADIGLRATRVLVARGRQVVFVKSIDIGGARFNEAVAKQLNVPVSEAIDLRLRVDRQKAEDNPSPPDGDALAPETSPGAPAAPGDRSTVDWTLHDAIRGEVELLGKEIALCLRYCSVAFRGVRAESVTVTGGEAHDPAVVSLLGEHLNLPCKVGSPLRGIDVSAADLVGDRRSNLAEWTLSAGLAARVADMPVALGEEQDGNRDRLSA